jgi:hypothetical protein
MNESTKQPAIDAVITWVDGYDPKHQQKLKNYLAAIGNPKAPGAAPTRFNQLGEIHYCVRSLLHFAPWLRKIYIVTDAQIPSIVNELASTEFADKVQVIDHLQIFYGFEQHLPSFNSLSIESVLWRIPDLAEHFIYLNDDCFLVAPVETTDFIRNEKLVLRGRWRTYLNDKWQNQLKSLFGLRKIPPVVADDLHRRIQENAARILGFQRKFYHLPHCPFILRKSTFANYFAKFPDLLANNVRPQLRELDQFWSVSLALHLEILQNNYVDEDDRSISVNPAHHSLEKIKARLGSVTQNNALFVCMQSMDAGDESTQTWMFNWLEASY